MQKLSFLFLSLFLFNCNTSTSEKVEKPAQKTVSLDKSQAENLIKLPLKCVEQEFPNKLSQVLSSAEDMGTPSQLHPAFYGCFDWHSAVHGHWVLVKLLKQFPNSDSSKKASEWLQKAITQENITQEIAYFNRKEEYSFERTYGWAWLLQLQLELDTWNTEEGKKLAENLRPLSELIVQKYKEFLPKLGYPIRVGTHSNTAFGLTFAYDYAVNSEDVAFQNIIKETAEKLFSKDTEYALKWEPNGTDFLSPAFEEIDLMRRILPKTEFMTWCKGFLPEVFNKDFSWEIAKVTDRTDGHLVHLDGLNFSRAWVLFGLAKQYPEEFAHLKPLAETHLQSSLPQITDGNYEGEHWLASFALYALAEKN